MLVNDSPASLTTNLACWFDQQLFARIILLLQDGASYVFVLHTLTLEVSSVRLKLDKESTFPLISSTSSDLDFCFLSCRYMKSYLSEEWHNLFLAPRSLDSRKILASPWIFMKRINVGYRKLVMQQWHSQTRYSKNHRSPQTLNTYTAIVVILEVQLFSMQVDTSCTHRRS